MTYNLSYRRVLNRMGYYNYQRGLIYHHLDEEGSWNSHLGNCRAFILKAMELRKPAQVTVLGSGCLLDLPLKEMVETGAEICQLENLPFEFLKKRSGGDDEALFLPSWSICPQQNRRMNGHGILNRKNRISSERNLHSG